MSTILPQKSWNEHLDKYVHHLAQGIHGKMEKYLGSKTTQWIEKGAQKIAHFIAQHKAEIFCFSLALISYGMSYSYFSATYWGKATFTRLAKKTLFYGIRDFCLIKLATTILQKNKQWSKESRNTVYYLFGALNMATLCLKGYKNILRTAMYTLGLLGSYTVSRLFSSKGSSQTESPIEK